MRYLSLFSGIEAASVAWEPLGWKPVAFCEIDAFPSAVLAHRFPEVPNHGDITKVDWRGYRGEVDVVVGGSPCQSFSIAGKREGLAGESGLMFEYIRAVREIMPRYFVWENVPGALSSEKGAAFGQLLREMDALGYGLAWRVLDAQFFGMAQRRERVFLVGCLGEAQRAGEVLFERESLCWDSPSSREKRKALAAEAERGAGGCCLPLNTMIVTRGGKLGRGTGFGMGEDGEAQFTLSTAHSHAVAYEPEAFGIDHVITGGGNCTAKGPCVYEEVQATLKAGGVHAVAHEAADPVYCIQGDIARGAHMGQNGCGWSDTGEAYTLNTLDVPAAAYTMQIRCGCEGGGKGAPIQEDMSATLSTGNNQTLFVPICMADDNAKAAIDEDMCGSLKVGGSAPLVANPPMQVRRLMPVECERLQGFPDDWTRIPYKGKEAEDCPDGPRYKALGNSMAVPVMRWIGERIEKAEGNRL